MSGERLSTLWECSHCGGVCGGPEPHTAEECRDRLQAQRDEAHALLWAISDTITEAMRSDADWVLPRSIEAIPDRIAAALGEER